MNELNPVEEYHIEREAELRFEVEGKKSVEVTLLAGKAEIFGTELAPNKVYTFAPGSKIAIFSWFSCTVKVAGKTEGTYIARETPMVVYANTHSCLEKLRVASDNTLKSGDDKAARGPVTMVVGGADVGKTTVCRMLINYAVRRGRRPIYVDLDVDQGSISVPGTIGSILVERAATVDEGFSQEAPLVYNFGHSSPKKNMTLYNILVAKMAEAVSLKMDSNKKIASSGVFINTCGWVKEEGYKCLTYIAQCFEIDVILVLDNERLLNDLIRDLGFVKVVFLPKSRGVVERTPSMRVQVRDNRIRQYFYGLKTKYHPHVFDVPYSQLQIYKIGVPALPDSCMPVDMKVDDHWTKIVKVEPSPKLMHSMLAMSLADEPEGLLATNVAAFVCVLGVNEETRMVSVLSTQPKPLPKFLLVQTDILFMDSN